jgi:hypothetical protein
MWTEAMRLQWRATTCIVTQRDCDRCYYRAHLIPIPLTATGLRSERSSAFWNLLTGAVS